MTAKYDVFKAKTKTGWNLLLRKPIAVIEAEEANEALARELSLFDMLCIGIGGTVGTGIFATAGTIISGTAGPAAVLSWMIAGAACCLSGFAYMELTTRVPSSGSSYAYAYYALGELPAFIAGFLLTLEYGVAGAGVARSWAAKVQQFAEAEHPGTSYAWLNEEHYNLMAGLVQALAVCILLAGLRFGKLFINTITITKICLVIFMIIAGGTTMNMENYSPLIPDVKIVNDEERYGWRGVMLGASQAFFGYVGFDEVCCLAAEAKNPRKTMPLAVIGTVAGTCILSALASYVLAGMQPFEQVVGFAEAFTSVNLPWASTLVRVGETLTSTFSFVDFKLFIVKYLCIYSSSACRRFDCILGSTSFTICYGSRWPFTSNLL